jgi:predicted outer membrane protein
MKVKSMFVCSAIFGLTAALLPHAARAANDDDKKFLAMAAQSDQNEIALSELAEQKATNPAVKAFAEKMVTEHKKMTASMKPFAVSWGLTAPTGPDDDHRLRQRIHQRYGLRPCECAGRIHQRSKGHKGPKVPGCRPQGQDSSCRA